MDISRRGFLKNVDLGAAGLSLGAPLTACSPGEIKGESMSLLVAKNQGILQSSAPYTKEWMVLDI